MLSIFQNSKLEFLFYNSKDAAPNCDAEGNLIQLESMVLEDKILGSLRYFCHTDMGPYTRDLFKILWVASYRYGLDKVVKDYLKDFGKLHEDSFDYHPNDEFGLESQTSHTPGYAWLLGYLKGLGYNKDQAKQIIYLSRNVTKSKNFNMCTIMSSLKPDGYEIMKTHKIGEVEIHEIELRGTRTSAIMIPPSSGKDEPEKGAFGIVLSRPSTRF